MYESINEMLDIIGLEEFLESEDYEYRIRPGSSGDQINVKECPVCHKEEWKVYINRDTNLGNCFSGSCQTGFNKYKFIKAVFGIDRNKDFIHALNLYASSFGWRPKRKTRNYVEPESELILPDSYALNSVNGNHSYLENRGIDVETAEFFNLRYSSTGSFVFIYKGDSISQDFSGRIIIPIFDHNNELVSFQGRDVTGQAEKKYLFPSGYSSTGTLLYNIANVVGCETVIIGEGVFDVIAAHMAMNQEVTLRDVGVVGSFGKHLSAGDTNGNDQLNKFIYLRDNGLKKVVFMWDSEKSTLTSACKFGLLLKSIGLKSELAVLPDGTDPNEVSSFVVQQAFLNAKTITRAMYTRMMLKNS